MRTTERRAGRQRGQSTVEFVVLAMALVPLLLIVPLLGKYMDIAQTAATASRYVAFEGSWRHGSSKDDWKTDPELAREVRRRFFSNSDAPIKTDDTAGDFNAHRNTLWFDHRGAPLLPEFASAVGVETQRESLDHPFGAAFSDSFGLSRRNLYTARINIVIADIANLPVFDALGLTITRHTTLLADPWAAAGPGVVRNRIRNAGAAFPYGALELAAIPINPLISLFEFGSSPPSIGLVEPDRVPGDRLGGTP